MSGNVQPQPEPSLATFGTEIVRTALAQMNCHALGSVEAFDPAKQSARARIGYKRQSADGKISDYPLLVDCPVVFLGNAAGAARLTFPLVKGDDCLVLFNDRNMDHWIVAGQSAVPDTGRLHSFSDAIILPGVRPFCRALPTFYPDGLELAYGAATLQLSDKVHLANATTDLKAVLNGLIDILAGLTVATASPGTPSPLSPAVITQLNTYKTTIGGLLK